MVNRRIYHTVNICSMLMTLNILIDFKFIFDWTKALFYRSKISSHGEENKVGRFHSRLRRWDVLMLTQISTVVKQIILIHETVMML